MLGCKGNGSTTHFGWVPKRWQQRRHVPWQPFCEWLQFLWHVLVLFSVHKVVSPRFKCAHKHRRVRGYSSRLKIPMGRRTLPHFRLLPEGGRQNIVFHWHKDFSPLVETVFWIQGCVWTGGGSRRWLLTKVIIPKRRNV